MIESCFRHAPASGGKQCRIYLRFAAAHEACGAPQSRSPLSCTKTRKSVLRLPPSAPLLTLLQQLIMEAQEVLGPSRPRSNARGKKREREPEPSPAAGPSTPGTPASQASQDEEGEEPADEVSLRFFPAANFQLLIAFRSEVVGIQHYNGLVGAGEYVMLRRQPQNPYDSNAVQVSSSPPPLTQADERF